MKDEKHRIVQTMVTNAGVLNFAAVERFFLLYIAGNHIIIIKKNKYKTNTFLLENVIISNRCCLYISSDGTIIIIIYVPSNPMDNVVHILKFFSGNPVRNKT